MGHIPNSIASCLKNIGYIGVPQEIKGSVRWQVLLEDNDDIMYNKLMEEIL